jgi:hypothetical protein
MGKKMTKEIVPRKNGTRPKRGFNSTVWIDSKTADQNVLMSTGTLRLSFEPDPTFSSSRAE